jgi:hypothetical protein
MRYQRLDRCIHTTGGEMDYTLVAALAGVGIIIAGGFIFFAMDFGRPSDANSKRKK